MKLIQSNDLQLFNGYWMSKKSVYLIKKKLEFQYQEFIFIDLVNNKYQLKYKFLENESYFFMNQINHHLFNFVQKNVKIIKFYNVIYKYSKLLKITIKTHGKNLCYEEYIYSISENLKISIGFLKNKNIYFAVIFTSYIKLFK